jgi:hypothetical protein
MPLPAEYSANQCIHQKLEIEHHDHAGDCPRQPGKNWVETGLKSPGTPLFRLP